ncbi:hypothetical protein ACLRGI_05010 [Paenarthrobacter nitroguajacolicus]|uniref:hypothetical protein n=1 Tax=Paenarthrobacter nitroguajacolicus TaxID=211146 RepID=UPI003AEA2181
MGPLDKGGPLMPGKVYFAPAGTDILTFDQWQELGAAGPISFEDGPEEINTWNGQTIRTSVPVIGTTLTFTCIPPKTRRAKRERLAALRLLYGHWPTHFPPKRQLIHNGRKPRGRKT